ncbi:GNAT family N-acetyltransferase [bacterium]|nr:GNAT family N-acetyltransferase [bacterium]
MNKTNLTSHPLTTERWSDFEQLFGKNGACGGCWCMFWRVTNQEFKQDKGDGLHDEMKSLVDTGRVPGLLAYAGERPVGWISLAPREEFVRFKTSRILKPVDDADNLWSIVCFFVAKEVRRQGVNQFLIRSAIDYAFANGCEVLEAYPYDITENRPAPFVYTGIASTFRTVGFEEVARRSETRPIMRYYKPE